MHEDLYLLSDEVFGWDSDYEILRGAGIEGVRAHPGVYARGVARTMWDELSKAQFRVVSAPPPEGLQAVSRRRRSSSTEAAARADRGRADPRRSGRLDLAAGQEHPAGLDVADRVALRVRAGSSDPASSASSAGRGRLFDALPDRAGNARLALRLNQLSRWFPRPWMWILLGLVAIVLRRPRGWPTLVALALAAFACVLLNALGLFADLHFVLPRTGLRAPRPGRAARSARRYGPTVLTIASTTRARRVAVHLANHLAGDPASLLRELVGVRERSPDPVHDLLERLRTVEGARRRELRGSARQ